MSKRKTKTPKRKKEKRFTVSLTERDYAKLKKLDCDVFFAPHGGAFAMTQKFAKLDQGASPNPFIDPDGWLKTINDAEVGFRRQLAAERQAAAATQPARTQ